MFSAKPRKKQADSFERVKYLSNYCLLMSIFRNLSRLTSLYLLLHKWVRCWLLRGFIALFYSEFVHFSYSNILELKEINFTLICPYHVLKIFIKLLCFYLFGCFDWNNHFYKKIFVPKKQTVIPASAPFLIISMSLSLPSNHGCICIFSLCTNAFEPFPISRQSGFLLVQVIP